MNRIIKGPVPEAIACFVIVGLIIGGIVTGRLDSVLASILAGAVIGFAAAAVGFHLPDKHNDDY